MLHPVILKELAKARRRDLLREADMRRLAAQARQNQLSQAGSDVPSGTPDRRLKRHPAWLGGGKLTHRGAH